MSRQVIFRFDMEGHSFQIHLSDFFEARRLGNTLACEYGTVAMWSFNYGRLQWDYLGEYLGDRKFRSSITKDGTVAYISKDFKKLTSIKED